MKNTIYAAALLISGTMLLCADVGFFSALGLGFMVLSFGIWLAAPIAKYFATYYPKQEQEQDKEQEQEQDSQK